MYREKADTKLTLSCDKFDINLFQKSDDKNMTIKVFLDFILHFIKICHIYVSKITVSYIKGVGNYQILVVLPLCII